MNMKCDARKTKLETRNMKRETDTWETVRVRNSFAFRVSRLAFPSGSGFTLVEVLLAVFILGIGLIMVACIFPVGADWTRQNTEETVAQMVAETGRGIVLSKYVYSDVSAVGTGVQLMPNMPTKLPIGERAYALGSSPAYPAATPNSAPYFWLPLIRKDPDTPALGSRPRFDVFILVFKKGDVAQTYVNALPTGATAVSSGDASTVPIVAQTTVATLAANVPVGSMGIGVTSGTVCRILPGGATSIPLMAIESVDYAPAADSTVSSPLVYIYEFKANF
jgi:prepilin-type N-terminal cleavage/methylation domain-containing protein